MSKSNHKAAQHKEPKNASETNPSFDGAKGEESFDSNQSSKSMAAASERADSSANQGSKAVSSVEDNEPSRAFGEPEMLDDKPSTKMSKDEASSEKTSLESTIAHTAEGLISKAASMVDSEKVKKNLNIVKDKANDLLHTGREQISSKYAGLSDDVKLRGMLVDDSVKKNPYAYALGAAGLGFILGRALSGKGKQDLDFLVSSVNKINLATLAGYFGVKMTGEEESSTASSDSSEKAGYNEKQARKIG